MSNHNGNTLSEDQKKALDLAATLGGLEPGSNDYDALDSQLNDLWFGSNFPGRRHEWLESLGYQKPSTTAGQEPVDQTVVETDGVEEEQPTVEEVVSSDEVNLSYIEQEGDYVFNDSTAGQTMSVREQPDGTVSIGGTLLEHQPEHSQYAMQDHVVVGQAFDGQVGYDYTFDEETNTWYSDDTPILKYLPGTGIYKGLTPGS